MIAARTSVFENLREDVRRWGWKRSAFIRVISMLRRYAGLHIYRVNVRPLVRQYPVPGLPSGLTVRIVPPGELLKAADDPELDLGLDFVRDALARGDMAFGAFEGDRLVGYTWRTFTAAPDRDGLWVRVSHLTIMFAPRRSLPSYRRRRIHVATFFATFILVAHAFEADTEVSNSPASASADLAGRDGYRRIRVADAYLFRTPAVKKIESNRLS
jgi:hypothetical protein